MSGDFSYRPLYVGGNSTGLGLGGTLRGLDTLGRGRPHGSTTWKAGVQVVEPGEALAESVSRPLWLTRKLARGR